MSQEPDVITDNNDSPGISHQGLQVHFRHAGNVIEGDPVQESRKGIRLVMLDFASSAGQEVRVTKANGFGISR
jgi:hypothetical protein